MDRWNNLEDPEVIVILTSYWVRLTGRLSLGVWMRIGMMSHQLTNLSSQDSNRFTITVFQFLCRIADHVRLEKNGWQLVYWKHVGKRTSYIANLSRIQQALTGRHLCPTETNSSPSKQKPLENSIRQSSNHIRTIWKILELNYTIIEQAQIWS